MAVVSDPFVERQILGAMLRDGDAAAEFVDLHTLQPSDFVTPEHRLIADAIFDMRAFNRQVSIPAVASWLTQKEQLGLIGGESYLDELRENAGDIRGASSDLLAMSARRDLMELGALISIEANDGSRPIEEVIDRAEQRLLEVRRQGNTEARAIGDMLGGFWDKFQRQAQGEPVGGFPAGFEPLDKIITRFEQNSFVIIGGRPGDGKSTWLKFLSYLAAIVPAANQKKGIYIGNFEESEGVFIRRLIALMTRINSDLLKNPALLSQAQMENVDRAIGYLRSCPIFFDSSSGVTVPVFKSRVMKASRDCRSRFNVELAWGAADYLQRMKGPGEGETAIVQNVSQGLRDAAMPNVLNMPLLATAQLNRAPVDSSGHIRDYNPADLKQSGQIEQDAEIILFVKRPWIQITPDPTVVMAYEENTEQDGRPTQQWLVEPIQLNVAKNRDGSTGFSEMLVWHRYCGLFETLTAYRERTGNIVTV